MLSSKIEHAVCNSSTACYPTEHESGHVTSFTDFVGRFYLTIEPFLQKVAKFIDHETSVLVQLSACLGSEDAFRQ